MKTTRPINHRQLCNRNYLNCSLHELLEFENWLRDRYDGNTLFSLMEFFCWDKATWKRVYAEFKADSDTISAKSDKIADLMESSDSNISY